jgi:hypothetical protein
MPNWNITYSAIYNKKKKIQTRNGKFEKANARTLPKCPRSIIGFDGIGSSKLYRNTA